MKHAELVQLAERWLSSRVGFTFNDQMRAYTEEFPDVIGFKSTYSVLIECKANRANFLADRHKPFRIKPETGMGNFRFYCAPKGLIRPDELPAGWGLLEVWGTSTVRVVVDALARKYSKQGNPFYHECNRDAERAMMYAALRRIQLRGRMPEIYDSPYKS